MIFLRKSKLFLILANIHYIRQKEPKGLGDAIWCARKFIGNEPFAIMLGDDIVKNDKRPYGIVAPKGQEIDISISI